MTRHLNYNPGKDSVEYLEAINCGDNRRYILDQLLISLLAEKGRPNHQHHLIIGPRGSGKTHLLRILTAGRIAADPILSETYLPVVMPEETPLRSPGDLLLKFVERLSEQLKNTPKGMVTEKVQMARTQCLTALTTAKGMKNPLDRLPLMAATLESVGETFGKILLPIAENMDQTFYLGAQRSRKGPQDEQWALRRYFQDSPHLLLIGAAPTLFGAAEDPDKAFYDFFRTHHLSELSNDEVLEIIHRRLEYEKKNPCADVLRHERITSLIDHFSEKSPQLRGIIVITGGLPRFIHLIYEVIVDTDVNRVFDTLNGFLDDLTPYFQTRLDPRIIPQAEIDLLHTLASARGPLQPSEIADELYGVPSNEVSELLNRLHERGLVKRAGRPGGQAVTWDLTEPLYRVWTQFRDNPDGQDLYQMLAKFVALLFSMPDIEKERQNLMEKIASLPDDHSEKTKYLSRKQLIDYAYNERLNANAETNGDTGVKADKVKDGPSINENKGLEIFRALNEALKNGNMDLALSQLQKLRELQKAFPADEKVRETLAKGLVNSINIAGKEGNLELSNSLLDELRLLNGFFPDDEKVREKLGMGLVNSSYFVGNKGNVEFRIALLDELRLLNGSFPDDEKVREQLAMGLVNSIYFTGNEGNLEFRNALLDELRLLNGSFPDDEKVRGRLAMGLFNSIHFAGREENLELRDALLDELRLLNESFPDDEKVREQLANRLVISINDARNEGNLELRKALLDELRLLSGSFSDDEKVRENLAMGLVNSINFAGNEGNLELGNSLLDELRLLNGSFPDDEKIREKLAAGLFNSIYDAGEKGNLELRNALLGELLELSAPKTNETIDELIDRAAMLYAADMIALMKTGDSDSARNGIKWLEARMPAHFAVLMHLFSLAMDVLEKGEEKALAREPEEVKRVVRLVLEQVDKKK